MKQLNKKLGLNKHTHSSKLPVLVTEWGIMTGMHVNIFSYMKTGPVALPGY